MLNDLIKQSNSKLGDDEVDALIDHIIFVENKFERTLTKEIVKVNQSIAEEISKVNKKISVSHANLIKWMFIFWIGQIGVILGILFAFLNHNFDLDIRILPKVVWQTFGRAKSTISN